MQQDTEREHVASFEGPHGKAEMYEIVVTFPDRPHVEEVHYEVVFEGQSQTRPSIGEASILACQLSGDQRYGVDMADASSGG
jgi:hypothetical protein